MITLYLDTTSSFLYTALIKDGETIAEIKEQLNNSLSEYTLPRIEEMLTVKGISVDEIGKIIVVNGPGSFTGIRIGLTIAKTLAWAKNIPIIPISSLEAMALSADADYDFVAPAIDARRGFVYASIYDVKNNSFVIIAETLICITKTINDLFINGFGEILFIIMSKANQKDSEKRERKTVCAYIGKQIIFLKSSQFTKQHSANIANEKKRIRVFDRSEKKLL